MVAPPSTAAIQERVWNGRVPLQIVLSPSECRTYDKVDPYLICFPRISYLPLLLPRLRAFFSHSLINPNVDAHRGWFSFEGVPLKWHYPLGLLFDLYGGADPASPNSMGHEHMAQSTLLREEPQRSDDEEDDDDAPNENMQSLPWRLTVHFSDWPKQDLVQLDAEGKVMHDAFINSVKEADYLRNGTAKGIMSLSKEDSYGLWEAVLDDDLAKHHRINTILLPNQSTPFRNIPLRIFLPSPPNSANPSLKVIQSTFPPIVPIGAASPSRAQSGRSSSPSQTQTIGTALNTLLPSLFPSKRFPVLAKPVLHGAVVPMNAPLDELVRTAAYADGWLGVVVSMVG